MAAFFLVGEAEKPNLCITIPSLMAEVYRTHVKLAFLLSTLGFYQVLEKFSSLIV
jgi:hypothetical protein